MKKFCSHLIIFIIIMNSFSGCALALGLFAEPEEKKPSTTITIEKKPEIKELTPGEPDAIKKLFATHTEISISWMPAISPEISEPNIKYIVYYASEDRTPEIASPEDFFELENARFLQIEGNPGLTQITGLNPDTSYRIYVVAGDSNENYVLYRPATFKTDKNQSFFVFEDSKTSTTLESDSSETEKTLALAYPEASPLSYQNLTITANVQFTSNNIDESWVGIIARASEIGDNHYKGYLFRFSHDSMDIGAYRNNNNSFQTILDKKPQLQSSGGSNYQIKVSIQDDLLFFEVATIDGAEFTRSLKTTNTIFRAEGLLVLYSNNASTTISDVNIYSSEIAVE